jgi:hypothetical protein
LPKTRLDSGNLRLGVFDRRFVVLGDAELEIFSSFADVFRELLDGLELAFGVRPLAEERLRFGLVVPEVGSASLLVQFCETSFELSDVKAPPLAHHGAF